MSSKDNVNYRDRPNDPGFDFNGKHYNGSLTSGEELEQAIIASGLSVDEVSALHPAKGWAPDEALSRPQAEQIAAKAYSRALTYLRDPAKAEATKSRMAAERVQMAMASAERIAAGEAPGDANKAQKRVHIQATDDDDEDYVPTEEEMAEHSAAIDPDAIPLLLSPPPLAKIDIVKRARELAKAGEPRFKEGKVNSNGDFKPSLTAINQFKVFSALFEDEPQRKPHVDTWTGTVVDHNGATVDPRYPMKSWMRVMSIVGLEGSSPDPLRGLLKNWAFEYEWNNLSVQLGRRIPVWDGKPRMKTYLGELFETIQTPYTEQVSQYFWQSIYMRCMHPGSDAPIVVSLFGSQKTGKSFFGKRLSQIIMNDPTADTVQLNLSHLKGTGTNTFLRQITGHGVIAAIGEAAGLARGEMNEIKDFASRTADKFDLKYDPTLHQLRQWILLMDGNKYEGTLRDDTGNRRFAPFFVAQLPDVDNKPAWKPIGEFNAGPFIASPQFEADVLQLLAEARDWYAKNGADAYTKLVSTTSDAVAAFSQVEVARGSGTILDQVIETYLHQALREVVLRVVARRGAPSGAKKTAVCVDRLDLVKALDEVAGKGLNINFAALKRAMLAYGGEEVSPSGKYSYRFAACADAAEFAAMLNGPESSEKVEQF
jgi:hypothetical protein